ncbi:hypothetical protein E5E96_20905 [Aeromonas sp. 1805]|uniref:DUF1780 domain-containing protein n=1 Tax=Aeromonas sp. 1805 TaxID=2560028 RepID=UPI00148AF991|nr:DUF1780 domain-containing protein [Aeromonas sp. 1805]QJT19499.1 hypothetical protein E5E96_20905 [Aeromonas sp. 1805]
MGDSEFIADRRAALEESVRYFSNKNKSERERWVVQTLLDNMNIPYRTEDVASPEQDPPDVTAFGGRFEIKEILDKGRKRHKEYKDALKLARTVTNPQDLLTEFKPVKSSVQEIFQLCSIEIEALKNKYPTNLRSNLDLLFYFNLRHVFDVEEKPFPDVSVLASCGWRSISFIKGNIACCFYSSSDAPGWLQAKAGKLQHKMLK